MLISKYVEIRLQCSVEHYIVNSPNIFPNSVNQSFHIQYSRLSTQHPQVPKHPVRVNSLVALQKFSFILLFFQSKKIFCLKIIIIYVFFHFKISYLEFFIYLFFWGSPSPNQENVLLNLLWFIRGRGGVSVIYFFIRSFSYFKEALCLGVNFPTGANMPHFSEFTWV